MSPSTPPSDARPPDGSDTRKDGGAGENRRDGSASNRDKTKRGDKTGKSPSGYNN